MENGTLERELKSQLDRWGRDLTATAFTLDRNVAVEIVEGDEIAADALFVKESSIDIWGPWRRVFHCNHWWVVGHYLMHPCNTEREAGRICRTLQADWDES